MTLLNILHFPDNKLRQKGKNISTFDTKLHNIASNMLETMYESKGSGLAAVQVNIPIRLIVIDISESHDNPLYLVNPKITEKKDKIVFEEGCLSVPGFYEKVERYNSIVFTYQDLDGVIKTDSAEGLLAVCIQHEIDHLDGKLFVDYISDLKRDRIAKKIKKAELNDSLPVRKNVPYNI